MTDQLEQTEEYIKQVEQNMERTAKVFGGLIYKVFYWIAGGLEYIIKPLLPKDEDEKPF